MLHLGPMHLAFSVPVVQNKIAPCLPGVTLSFVAVRSFFCQLTSAEKRGFLPHLPRILEA